MALKESDEPNAHSSKLSLFIEDVFHEAGIDKKRLEAVCVSSGPGSYTGLRIGVSCAKGFCYALDIPLLAVPTLQSMALLYYQQHADYDGLVCPMIDARRMECYTAIYSRQGLVRDVAADIITEHLYDTYLEGNRMMFIGDGAEKTRPLLSWHSNALYDASFSVSAVGMAHIAQSKLQNMEKEDVAYFEPFYFKEYIAKKSVVRGLNYCCVIHLNG